MSPLTYAARVIRDRQYGPLSGRSAIPGLIRCLPLADHWLEVARTPTTYSIAGVQTRTAHPEAGHVLYVGGSAYLYAADAQWGTGSRTVSCWYRQQSVAGGTGIVSVGSSATDGSPRWIIQQNYATSYRVLCGNAYHDSGIVPAVGETVHLAFTWDSVSTNVRVYVNGILRSGPTARSDVGNTTNIYIGSGYGAASTGEIWDVRLYERALSSAEIWTLYDPRTRWDLWAVPQRGTLMNLVAGGPPAGRTTRHSRSHPLGIRSGSALPMGQTVWG